MRVSLKSFFQMDDRRTLVILFLNSPRDVQSQIAHQSGRTREHERSFDFRVKCTADTESEQKPTEYQDCVRTHQRHDFGN